MEPEVLCITSALCDVLFWSMLRVLRNTEMKIPRYGFWVLKSITPTSPCDDRSIDCHWGQPLVGFPWSKPSTQMTIGSLFGMVPTRLKPLTGLLSLIGYLGVVTWSIGKAGGGSRDGLCSHRVKVVLQIC